VKGSLAKRVRLQFERGLKERIPSASRVDRALLPSGWVGWLIGESDGATAYVVLGFASRADRFVIEIAWSLNKRLPENTTIGPGAIGRDAESRFQLSDLWRRNGGGVLYDLQSDADFPESGDYDVFAPDEPCIARIPIKVQRALDALDSYGIPYLRETVGLPVGD